MRHPRIIVAGIGLAAVAAAGGSTAAAAGGSSGTTAASASTAGSAAVRARAGQRRRQDRGHPGHRGLARLWPPLTSAAPAGGYGY